MIRSFSRLPNLKPIFIFQLTPQLIESKEDLEEFKKMVLEAYRKKREKEEEKEKDNNPIENK